MRGLPSWRTSGNEHDRDSTGGAAVGGGARGALPWQKWGMILIAPYVLVFVVFVLYPVGYGLWIARHPGSYTALLDDPIFDKAIVNTLIFVIVGVNVKMAIALVLSGFSSRPDVDQVAVAVIHPALGGAVDSDDPLDPLHAQSGVGDHKFADLSLHRARRSQLAQRPDDRAASPWCTSGSRCSGRSS
jgi:hypothetical protein